MTTSVKAIAMAHSEKTELTTQQCSRLANEYRTIAGAIRDYRSVNWDELNSVQRRQLTRFADKCMDYSDDYIYLGVRLAIGSEEITKAVAGITEATKDLKKAIRKLTRINKVILIATAAVTLAGAIMSGSPQAIGSAIAEALVVVSSTDDDEASDTSG